MENKIVLTVGTFDCFHAGHLNLLKECSKLGVVFAGLNTDEFIFKYKNKKPIFSYEERKTHLFDSGLVVDVIDNDQSDGTIKKLIEEINPKYLVIGSDWAKKDYYKQIGITQEYLDDKGITMVYVPYYKGISTSEIKKRICESL